MLSTLYSTFDHDLVSELQTLSRRRKRAGGAKKVKRRRKRKS